MRESIENLREWMDRARDVSLPMQERLLAASLVIENLSTVLDALSAILARGPRSL